MTEASINISADEATSDGGEHVSAIEFERLQVSFPAEQGYDTRCRHCFETIEQDESSRWVTSSYDGKSSATCEANDDEAHEPETGPGTWCNSAAVIVDEEEDSVTVTISVGDPRGAFAFTVRRIPADADTEHAGRLVLHTPYPGEGLPHMDLTEIRPGSFLIS